MRSLSIIRRCKINHLDDPLLITARCQWMHMSSSYSAFPPVMPPLASISSATSVWQRDRLLTAASPLHTYLIRSFCSVTDSTSTNSQPTNKASSSSTVAKTSLTRAQIDAAIARSKTRVNMDLIQAYVSWQRTLTCNRAVFGTYCFSDIFEQLLEPLKSGEPRKLAINDPSRNILKVDLRKRVLLVRPRRSGKSVLAQLVYEYYLGQNRMLFKQLEISKAISDDAMPQPNQFVCVYLDFSLASTLCFHFYLEATFNDVLEAAKLETMSPGLLDAQMIIQSFADIISEQGKQVAIIIDEYDSLVHRAEGEEDAKKAFRLTEDVFLSLKGLSRVFVRVFVSGTTRLALGSGINNITDVSFSSQWATALGYTWPQIETLFAQQLKRLEVVHSMSSEELRAAIEHWYDGYRFSPDSRTTVFSVWAINNFMESGEFIAHLTNTAASSRFSRGELLYLLSGEVESTPVIVQDLQQWRSSQFTSLLSTQMKLLFGGLLTFDRGFDIKPLILKVPNEDARIMITRVLANEFGEEVDAANINMFLEKGAILDALEVMQRDLRNFASDKAKLKNNRMSLREIHLQHAFSMLLSVIELKCPDASWKWRIKADTKEFATRGQPPAPDFIIDSQEHCHIIEFGRFRQEIHGTPRALLLKKLDQALKHSGAAHNAQKVTFSAVIWDPQGKLLCGAGPVEEDTVTKLCAGKAEKDSKEFSAAIRWSSNGESWSSNHTASVFSSSSTT